MITGYNTDVSHLDRAFHVQTEDKGTSNPYIESLIYVGGQVLAAKRTGYAAVLAQGRGEAAIIEMMDQQHRSMISAIRAGEYDQKVVELLGLPEPIEEVEDVVSGPMEADSSDGNVTTAERSLDEVILEYLTTEAQQEHLVLLLDEEVQLIFGKTTEIAVRTTTSKSGEAVVGAEVTVKMISTVTEPRILARGVTDGEGRLRAELEIPEVAQGSSALIITASSSLGQAELKYLL